MPFAFEEFLPGFVELIFDAALFAEGQFLGLDFGLLVASGRLNFGFFEDLAGFFFGVMLSQIADQLDDAHAHERGDAGRRTTISHGFVLSGRLLGQHE